MFRLKPDIVTPPAPPSVPPGMSGTPEALAALQRGDLRYLDDLELAWLNAFGPKPTITRDMISDEYCHGSLQPLAVGIKRGALPDGRLRVEWAMVTPCRRCWWRPTRRPGCTHCDGNGYMNMEGIWQSFYCDIDANIVGQDP